MEDVYVRRNALRVLGSVRQPRTFAAKGLEGPVKVLWGTEDSRLPMEVGAQLEAQFATAEFRQIEPHARAARSARVVGPGDIGPGRSAYAPALTRQQRATRVLRAICSRGSSR